MNRVTSQLKGWLVGLALTTTAAVGGISFADSQVDPYTDKGTGYELSITGHTTTEKVVLQKDKPEVTLSQWGGEHQLTIERSGSYNSASRELFSKTQSWESRDGKEEVLVEPTRSQLSQTDNGVKIDILLNEKPSTNVFTYQLGGWEDLDFFYQPELTPEELAAGIDRPENVVGSYAVYHKTKKHHLAGQNNYATGKLYHIYRPKVWDANNNEVWATLSYDAGTLSVTVPQDFLDTATYPVRVDPDFGYTTAGGTADNTVVVDTIAFKATGAAGTLTSISYYGNRTIANQSNMRAALYRDSDGSSVEIDGADHTLSATSPQWNTEAMAGTTVISAIDYLIAVTHGVNQGGGTFRIHYDSSGAEESYLDDGAGSAPNPFVKDVNYTRKYSIYATYTADAAASAPTKKTQGVIMFE